MYMYIYIYTYMYTYIYICVYISTHTLHMLYHTIAQYIIVQYII